MENHSYVITKQVNTEITDEILEMRNEYFYESPYNNHYWNGGIYTLLSKDDIVENQKNDLNSFFLLIYNSKNVLKAYSRFSVNSRIINKLRVSKLHIICSSKDFIKDDFYIDGRKEKVGVFLLEKVIDYCMNNNSDLLISEIAVHPYPNIPSLILHEKFNFISICNSIKKIKNNDGISISFVFFGKKLKDIELKPFRLVQLI